MSLDKGLDHLGHRKRKRQSFVLNSASATDADLLELLLYYAVPRVDTCPTANALLEKFGTLDGVLNADMSVLKGFSGIKDGAEVLFTLLSELLLRVGESAPIKICQTARIKRHLMLSYAYITQETVVALYFDENGVMVGGEAVYDGDVNAVKFPLRRVTEGAIRTGARSVILAHNHPSGKAIPSSDDIISTTRMAANLLANDIELAEHFIVSRDGCVGIINID